MLIGLAVKFTPAMSARLRDGLDRLRRRWLMSTRRWFKSVGSGERPGAPRGWPLLMTWPKSGSAWRWSTLSQRDASQPRGFIGRGIIDGGNDA